MELETTIGRRHDNAKANEDTDSVVWTSGTQGMRGVTIPLRAVGPRVLAPKGNNSLPPAGPAGQDLANFMYFREIRLTLLRFL